ncbi:MAG: hypothetical protein U0136_13215 [Bdellovibrionota bacterium]
MKFAAPAFLTLMIATLNTAYAQSSPEVAQPLCPPTRQISIGFSVSGVETSIEKADAVLAGKRARVQEVAKQVGLTNLIPSNRSYTLNSNPVAGGQPPDQVEYSLSESYELTSEESAKRLLAQLAKERFQVNMSVSETPGYGCSTQ